MICYSDAFKTTKTAFISSASSALAKEKISNQA
jgi:hypothetical protein